MTPTKRPRVVFPVVVHAPSLPLDEASCEPARSRARFVYCGPVTITLDGKVLSGVSNVRLG